MADLFTKLQAELKHCRTMRGITPADLLGFSSELRHLLNTITRQGNLSLAEATSELNIPPAELETLLDTLVEKGYLKDFNANGERRFKTFLARKPGRKVPSNIWDALGSNAE